MDSPSRHGARLGQVASTADFALPHCKPIRISSIGALALLLAFLVSTIVQSTSAQSAATPNLDEQAAKAVPILSAGMGFTSNLEGGQPHLHPLVSPVVLIPIGDRWLIESRDTFEIDLTQLPGSSVFHGALQKEVDYLQLDFIANANVTVTVGRFITPFGVYDERLYPIWIRDLQSDPLILPLATGPSGAGTGAMVRGGIPINKRVTLNYAAYFSTRVTSSPLDSSRFGGGRAGIYMPGPRLELGGSFQHLLQLDRTNSFGFHFAWQPTQAPLDLRGEYARTSQGSGYWVESAYRFAQPPVWKDLLSHLQLVGRMQEFFAGAQPDESLHPVNTKMVEFGLNYYFRDDLRFVSSFGRQFASISNENVWTIGLTYRFVLPLAGGEAH